jgi:CS domain
LKILGKNFTFKLFYNYLNSTYNGGETEKYKWSQNISDIEVQVNLPFKVTAKQLTVELTKTKIHICLKDDPTQIFISGEFYDTIKRDDSSWNLEEGVRIMLVLEKSTENIWKTIIKGD